MKLGSAIKRCRQIKSLTQEMLAKQADLSKSHLSLVEKGQRELSLDALNRIAKALDVPIQLIMYLAAEPSELKEMNASLKTEFDRLILDLLKDD